MDIPVFRYYAATSADGFIADAAGGVDWLNPFFNVDYGFHGFLASVDTVLMGRLTYEKLLNLSKENPYKGKKFVVISRSRSEGPYADLFWAGPLLELAERLGSMGSKSVWVVGGGVTASAFLGANLIDEVQQFLMPLALGSGTPLFGKLDRPVHLTLKDTKSFPNGVLKIQYVPKMD